MINRSQSLLSSADVSTIDPPEGMRTMSDYENNPLIVGIDARIAQAEAAHAKALAELAAVEAAGEDLTVFTEANQDEYKSLAYKANKGDKAAVARRAQLANDLTAAQPDNDQVSADLEAAQADATGKEAAVKAARADRAKALYYLAETDFAQGWQEIVDLMRETDEVRNKTAAAHGARAAAMAAGREFGLKFANLDFAYGSNDQIAAATAALIEKDAAILKELEAAQ